MRRFLPVAAAALAATGCAYIGGTLPPLANVPGPIGDLTAFQRGAVVIARFTLPTRTTEGMRIDSPLTLDLRAGGTGAATFDPASWAAAAKRFDPRSVTPRPVPVRSAKKKKSTRNPPPPPIEDATYEIPAAEWTGKDLTIAVRVIGENGKDSAWSNFVNVHVIPSPDKPAQLIATATGNGVHLTWRAAGQRFRVFRQAAPSEEFAPLAETKTPEYLDATAEFGKTYAYQVQTLAGLPGQSEVESERSDAVTIHPVDIFPPAAPAGLSSSPSPALIELTWDANTEPDLAGYRVYRSVDNGAFEKIAEVSTIPAYSDQKVERGKRYRYAITAFDKLNNESPRSAAIEAALQ